MCVKQNENIFDDQKYLTKYIKEFWGLKGEGSHKGPLA